jgi:hypothetical protein
LTTAQRQLELNVARPNDNTCICKLNHSFKERFRLWGGAENESLESSHVLGFVQQLLQLFAFYHTVFLACAVFDARQGVVDVTRDLGYLSGLLLYGVLGKGISEGPGTMGLWQSATAENEKKNINQN